MLEKIKNWLLKANSDGISIPLLKDPKTGQGSYTLTMYFISFNLATFLLLGKVTKLVGDVDYNNVLWLYGMSSSIYLGRAWQKKGDEVTLGENK
jgi:hypothetical protein